MGDSCPRKARSGSPSSFVRRLRRRGVGASPPTPPGLWLALSVG
jgi:hypothetical protein